MGGYWRKCAGPEGAAGRFGAVVCYIIRDPLRGWFGCCPASSVELDCRNSKGRICMQNNLTVFIVFGSSVDMHRRAI